MTIFLMVSGAVLMLSVVFIMIAPDITNAEDLKNHMGMDQGREDGI